MMRRSAGFDADKARRQLLKEWYDVPALELTANDYITCRVNSVDLKNRLRDIETDCRDRLHVWLLRIVGVSTAPTSMVLPCRWRSRPQHQKRTYAVQRKAYSFDHLAAAGEQPSRWKRSKGRDGRSFRSRIACTMARLLISAAYPERKVPRPAQCVTRDGNDPNASPADRSACRRGPCGTAVENRSLDPSRHRRHRACAHSRPAADRARSGIGSARDPATADLLGGRGHELARVSFQFAADHAAGGRLCRLHHLCGGRSGALAARYAACGRFRARRHRVAA